MDGETEYRIEFTIQRKRPGDEDFTELPDGCVAIYDATDPGWGSLTADWVPMRNLLQPSRTEGTPQCPSTTTAP